MGASAAPVAAAVPAKKPVKSSLLSLAKRRASSKEQEPGFDFDDPRFNKQRRLAPAPKQQPAPRPEALKPQAKAQAPMKPTGLAALARRRMASSCVLEEEEEEDPDSVVRVTT